MDLNNETTLLDLPNEILHQIMSHLKVEDFDNLTSVHGRFEQLSLLQRLANQMIRLNVNGCSCLGYVPLVMIMEMPKLQHLHAIDCNLNDIRDDFLWDNFLKLKSLSFRWDNQLTSNKLFQKSVKNIKNLTICYYKDNPLLSSLDAVLLFVFKNCPNVEKLRIYTPQSLYHKQTINPVVNDDHLINMLGNGFCLSKLSEFHMDVDIHLDLVDHLDRVIKAFIQNHKGLQKLYLGQLSCLVLGPEVGCEKIVSILANETTDKICLDSICRIEKYPIDELASTPVVWKDRTTPKCRIVSMRNLFVEDFIAVAVSMAKGCPLLQQLDLSGTVMDYSQLQNGMKVIIQNFPRLSHLNLVVYMIGYNSSSYCELLGHYISNLRGLKVLHLNAQLIDDNFLIPRNELHWEEYQEICERIDTKVGHSFYNITRKCSQIEEFYLVCIGYTSLRIADSNILALISNWRQLKILHLVNVPTYGLFLGKVFQNNQQLEEFHFGSKMNPSISDQYCCWCLEILLTYFQHAKALKRLSLIQFDNLMLYKLLDHLKYNVNLELLEAQFNTNDSSRIHEIARKLLRLPKLKYLGVSSSVTVNPALKIVKRRVSRVRPEFRFGIDQNQLDISHSVAQYHSFYHEFLPQIHIC